MLSRILHTSYIIDFLDVGFDSTKISNQLKSEVDKVLDDAGFRNLPELENWEIQFKSVYSKKTPLRIYPKIPIYKKDKLKLITIHIPIPLKTSVEWGVDDTQNIILGNEPSMDKYAIPIDVDATKFHSRQDYIVYCLRTAIKKSFEIGFTVNKVQIKSEDANDGLHTTISTGKSTKKANLVH